MGNLLLRIEDSRSFFRASSDVPKAGMGLALTTFAYPLKSLPLLTF